MTQTPETHTPVNHQPEAWPVELVECPLSIGHATGRSGHGYLPHERGVITGPEEQ